MRHDAELHEATLHGVRLEEHFAIGGTTIFVCKTQVTTAQQTDEEDISAHIFLTVNDSHTTDHVIKSWVWFCPNSYNAFHFTSSEYFFKIEVQPPLPPHDPLLLNVLLTLT